MKGKLHVNTDATTTMTYVWGVTHVGMIIWILVWGAREAVSLMGTQPSGNRHDSVVYPLARDPDRVSVTSPLASRNKIPLLFSLTTRHFPSKYFVHVPKQAQQP